MIIDDADAKPKRVRRSSTRGTASINSDESTEETGLKDPRISSATKRSTRDSVAGTSSENSGSTKKRKNDDADSIKTRKVTFEDGKQHQRKKVDKAKPRPAGAGTFYGTRSTRGELLSELPPPSKPKSTNKTSAISKMRNDKYVEVIKMLTGTLYYL